MKIYETPWQIHIFHHPNDQLGDPMLPDAFPSLPPSVYERASELAADIRLIELENSELRCKVLVLEANAQVVERNARVQLDYLRERISNRIKSLEKKLAKAQESGDLAAAAQADARIRALADLLDL